MSLAGQSVGGSASGCACRSVRALSHRRTGQRRLLEVVCACLCVCAFAVVHPST